MTRGTHLENPPSHAGITASPAVFAARFERDDGSFPRFTLQRAAPIADRSGSRSETFRGSGRTKTKNKADTAKPLTPRIPLDIAKTHVTRSSFHPVGGPTNTLTAGRSLRRLAKVRMGVWHRPTPSLPVPRSGLA